MKRLLPLILLAGCSTKPALTVYMPSGYTATSTADFCLSNRTDRLIQIPHGAVLEPGQAVIAVLGDDMVWSFLVHKATDREDADCLVIEK